MHDGHVRTATVRRMESKNVKIRGTFLHVFSIVAQFLRATAVQAGTAESAYYSYGDYVCLSVCGVTTRYRINPRSDRDTGFHRMIA